MILFINAAEEILNKKETGLFAKLVKIGLIDWRLLHHRDIYLRFDIYKKQGLDTVEAVEKVALEFDITERKVYRAIKKMTS